MDFWVDLRTCTTSHMYVYMIIQSQHLLTRVTRNHTPSKSTSGWVNDSTCYTNTIRKTSTTKQEGKKTYQREAVDLFAQQAHKKEWHCNRALPHEKEL